MAKFGRDSAVRPRARSHTRGNLDKPEEKKLHAAPVDKPELQPPSDSASPHRHTRSRPQSPRMGSSETHARFRWLVAGHACSPPGTAMPVTAETPPPGVAPGQ